MLPDWAFGFWQSRNKYNTQNEVLSTLAEFRRREIPIDTIVQDWQYWPPDRWGDHDSRRRATRIRRRWFGRSTISTRTS